jgi:hypothetical protein
MGPFEAASKRLAAFCLPLCYYLAPFAISLDKPSEVDYYENDDDFYAHDFWIKQMIFFRHIDNFFKENKEVYEDEIKDKCYNIFN